MSKLELVSFNLCPYVQRSRILLLEKGVEHDVTYIDLGDKPDWFLKISPFGKVPLLRVDGRVLFESNVIAEYVDEVYAPQLHPSEPLDKAEHRSWIEYAGALGAPGYRMMVLQSEEDVRKEAKRANELLERLEAVVVGPFFAGETFAVIDASAAPFLQRLHWSDALVDDLNIFENRPKCRAWTDHLLARKSVQDSLQPNIHATFIDYLKGRGSPTRNAESSWLGSVAPTAR